MPEIDTIKESVDYQQLVREDSIDQMLKGEFLIPDTHPDVQEIISVSGRTNLTRKESLGDRILLEGNIEYVVLYLAREEEGLVLNSVSYNDKFSNYIEGLEAEHRISCEALAKIEHIEGRIINERKISIEGVLNISAECYKNSQIDFLKDIVGVKDIQVLRKPEVIDKLVAKKEIDFSGTGTIIIGMDKPQVGKIIKTSLNIHKEDIKLNEDRVTVSCFCKVELLYRASETREVILAEEDIFISKDEEVIGVSSNMTSLGNFSLTNYDLKVREDDLGEARKIEIDVQARADFKIMDKSHMDFIDDVYSPSMNIDVKQQDTNVGIVNDKGNAEAVIKENLQVTDSSAMPSKILSTTGNATITEKKIMYGKALIDGLLNVEVIYMAEGGEKEVGKMNSEIPFNVTVDLPNSIEDAKCIAKSVIESIQGVIEGSTIAIKAIVSVEVKSISNALKKWVSSLETKEGETQGKKASIIIYVVQLGDTIWSLAKKYATTMDALVKLNNLEADENLKVGTKLLIPGRAVI
ncbi:DUF3794 and LysM peptidoglycan-binding domain-containing protein [Clostridium sp. 'White wine YQ']|uniref:DUF3794 and LysM peptidoglycan-binding domain-containing protein n=1 Tax=Clostridium sp. 'White wine YQ' TaxID=3027474 RepID=UPI002365E125|nr:SPOCS domain-containing protein [Clostridium sp. 'White wine YQ']MDD7792672.1 DUF3794 domain-containing protein [Clostridium sp. 'White wine YQ']